MPTLASNMPNLNDVANILRGANHRLFTALAEVIGWAFRNASELAVPLVTSGAIDPTQLVTNVSTTGSTTLQLADGRWIGQEVNLRQTVAASVPSAVVTPASRVGYASFNLGTAVNNGATLVWNGTGWVIVRIFGAGVAVTP